MDNMQTDKAAGQKMHNSILESLQSRFFDYAAIIAERAPGKAAASVKILNSALDLIKGEDSSSIEYTKLLLEDMHTMIASVQEP